ncbi:putative secreted protein (Por secretion system target) [Spirosoma oryzae]|uniref:Putative secreted protein (Por secretion system target) n=1 Tax=Spirosoma oryzae TaxID=1469603 RepID=A0A2T0TEH2_9BACT|nr:fibronectin type III domain-containing protein [Spirosoma oryzae]PRY44060.1 putative secreted protein (Por secretion system target) [Spirosoma oryzae]
MKRVYLITLVGTAMLLSLSALAQSNAPSALSGSAPAYNRVVLTWKDNTTNETKFEIERNDFTSFTKVGEAAANATTYTDNSVQGNGSYTYRVRAVLATGAVTTYSGEAKVTTPATPPTTPTSLGATTQSPSTIRLSWTNPGGGTATDFLLERGTSSNGPFTQIATVAYSRSLTYDDTGLASGTTYCYRVRARGPGGTSDYSNTACATTTAVPPVTPSGLSVSSLSTSQLQLTWSDINVVPVTFEISRASSAGGAYQVIQAEFGQKIFTDNNLSANTQYCYKVRAKTSAGLYSGYSNEACGTTKAPVPTAPTAPARLEVAAVSSSQINLKWADLSDNETGFQVERAPASSGTFTKIADVAANATTYSDNGLSGGTTYCYRVRAINGVGASGYTDAQCTTTPAAPAGVPQNLVATAASTTQINLSWSGVSGASGYQLERSPNGTDGWTKIADLAGTATTYSDPNLTPNVRYFYRIRALNAAGAPGGYSNTADATTPDTPPAAPVRLVITAVIYNQISLQWAAGSANQSGFQLERSPDGSTWTKLAEVAANAMTYVDNTVQPQTRYVYRLRAVNAAGASGYSNVVDATTPAGPPASPQNLVATAVSTTQINLSWSAVATATNVLVERSPNGNDGWTQLVSLPGEATSYADQGLTPNTRYYYRIRATNGSGTGPYSAVVDATTPDAPPVAPARLTATAVSFSQITLQWADLSGNESGFQLERSSTGTDGWAKVADVAANATTYSDPNLSPRTRYFYRIRAVNAAGASDYSNVADATTPDSPPAAPTQLTATAASTTQINLQWTDASDNETGFDLERSTDGATFTKIADVAANATTYSDQGLTPNTRYFYRIRAKNAVGTSAYSAVVDATTPDVPPAAPTQLTAAATSPTQVVLTWADLSGNESGFQLERGSSATGSFTKVADITANTTTHTDTGLTDATPYCYRLRAVNAAGPSGYTDAVCVTTPLAPPGAPTDLTAQLQDYDQIRLTWAAVSPKAVTISIERATSPTGPFAEVKQVPVPVSSYVDPGLSEFTTYYYRVRAMNTAGSSGYSNVASARVNEVVIAVEDEIDTHTDLYVNDRTLHVVTNWFSVASTTLQLLTATGQPVLSDHRTVRPADRWHYNLSQLATGVYIVQLVADGRKLAKRIVLP